MSCFSGLVLSVFISLISMPALGDQVKPQTPQLIIFGYPHQIVDPFTLYPIRLLKAALDKSAEPYILQASPVPMVQDRSLREIAAGERTHNEQYLC